MLPCCNECKSKRTMQLCTSWLAVVAFAAWSMLSLFRDQDVAPRLFANYEMKHLQLKPRYQVSLHGPCIAMLTMHTGASNVQCHTCFSIFAFFFSLVPSSRLISISPIQTTPSCVSSHDLGKAPFHHHSPTVDQLLSPGAVNCPWPEPVTRQRSTLSPNHSMATNFQLRR
jgi:hypothetical protein